MARRELDGKERARWQGESSMARRELDGKERARWQGESVKGLRGWGFFAQQAYFSQLSSFAYMTRYSLFPGFLVDTADLTIRSAPARLDTASGLGLLRRGHLVMPD
ncbi:hypothetical protein G6O67_001021 [Ophiocordyceps sinensis]|uniref:Uncharacterized protein n=1 Tax=Ophiocordyceps sinensis TaxID=72228 RepID=A0A8H4PX07_9HYPO|nr:hypothetical protein G6O67_001021 [Ophiocordyceps sinensis]